jgi:predicted PurR-regulated permease PerM
MSSSKAPAKLKLRASSTGSMEEEAFGRTVSRKAPCFEAKAINGAETTGRPSRPRAGSGRENAIFALQIVLTIMAGIAFLYFARATVLPIVVACVAGTALKPLMRGLAYCRIPAGLGAALILMVFITLLGTGFTHLSRPAVVWMNEAPVRVAQLKQRLQKIFRPAVQISQVAAAVNNLGKTEEEQKKTTTVEVRDQHAAGMVINWTGGLVASLVETLVLLYLMLAAGDLFLQKLVRIAPTRHDKRCAVEIGREIQQNISNYLFSISLINMGLGTAVSAGLYFIGVPNAALWGTLAALLNYLPYFGPLAGVTLLGVVGLLTFDTLPKELLPPVWYLLLHLAESNLITPVLLGRRFTLNPVVIFVSLIFWTWLWGVPGALLAVPILIYLKAIADRLPALAPVSELLAH